MSPTLATIVHLDADAFFVSVELAKRPELRGKRVAVGGRERGIISSASYEARAAGVYTPMPTQRALRVCPDLILLPHRGDYGGVSRRMFDLCETLTPVVQRNSIDEGYLDLTPCAHRTQTEIEAAVRELQTRLWNELQIPVSIGIATNRLVAQIASKLRKPRGFVVVPPGTEAGFLAPLDLGRLPGVGPKTEAALRERGLVRVSDVFARSETELAAIFGDDWRAFVARCRGEDDRAVHAERDDAKSYSQQETFFENIAEFAAIERIAKGMIDDLMPKIRADRARVRTLTIKVRYPDFTHASAGRSLPQGTDLESPFYPLVGPLLRHAWTKRKPLRLVSVKLSGVDDGPEQLEMFAQADEKRRRLAGVLDRLNNARRRGEPPKVQHGHQLGGPQSSM
jgi:DNA polymerase-4